MAGRIEERHVSFGRKEWLAFLVGLATTLMTVVASAVFSAVGVTRHIDDRFEMLNVQQARTETRVA